MPILTSADIERGEKGWSLMVHGAPVSLEKILSLSLGAEIKSNDRDALSTTIPVSILDHDANERVTLADGSSVGQIKVIFSSTNNTVDITPATTAGAYSKISTTNIGSVVILMWTPDGWGVLSRSSGAIRPANAVAQLPILHR